jgi:uncharacterized repeat protein (TIGR01451 family)
VVRFRILAAGLALAAAGCLALGWSSHPRKTAAHAGAGIPALNFAAMGHGTGSAGIGVSADRSGKFGAQNHSSAVRARSLFAGLPLMFEPNLGQGNLDVKDSRAKFIARGPQYSLFLGSEGAILKLRRAGAARRGSASPSQVESVEMKLVGANLNASIAAADPLPGKSNYLLGSDPAKWRRDVPQFRRVRYENVYPGINLVFYGNQGRLEYDFQVAPGSDPKQAEIEFDGAKRLSVKNGALVVKGERADGGGDIVRLEAPTIYQEVAGRRQPVEGKFVLRGAHRVGFAVGAYDHSRTLVIDPVLSFSTYFGGAGNELNNYVAVDQAFNVYLAGSTDSTNLPVTPGVQQPALNTTPPNTNVYIAKMNPSANPPMLLYVTYLGGSGSDYPVGVGVDGESDPYVAGTTTSTNFPTSTTNPYQATVETGSAGTSHVFVTRMNSSASGLVYSSYLSGSGTDVASGMTIDGLGFIYVTGTTTSTNPVDYAIGVVPPGIQWPVISLPNGLPFQNTPKATAGVAQFFVTKVNTQGFGSASITYSTYFGGGDWQPLTSNGLPTTTGGGIAVDTNGIIYFTGTTNFLYVGMTGTQLTDFPILNAYQPCLDQPAPAVIVNPPSCTYTSGAATASDAFLAKLNPNEPSGTGQLGWSTYLGGTGTDSGTGIAVDTGAANVYITGTTNSTDIAASQSTSTTSAAYQRCLDTPTNPAPGTACTPPAPPIPNDAFVAKFPNLTATNTTSNLQLTYFSYLGGSADEAGLAIAVDEAGGALLTGSTQSNMSATSPFSVVGGQDIQGTFFTAAQDAFFARINTAATLQNPSGNWTAVFGGSTSGVSGVGAMTEGTGIALDVDQNTYIAGDTNTSDLQVVKPVQATYGGGSDAFVAQLGTASAMAITGVLTLGSNQTYVSAGNLATFTYTITNSGPDPAFNISVVDNLTNTGITGQSVPVTFDFASATSGTCGGSSSSTVISCAIPSLQAGTTATVTIVVIPTSIGAQRAEPFSGGTVQVLSETGILLAQTFVPGTVSDYGMSISPASESVAAGNTASYQVSLVPDPVYGSSISLACSGVPAASSCNFTSTSVTLAGQSPGSSTLNITTTVRPITTASSPWMRRFYALWLMVPGLALFGLGSADRRRRRIAGILMLCSVFSLLVVLPACSHAVVQPPVSGTPAGTYTINVTATSGSDSKTQSIVLNVS